MPCLRFINHKLGTLTKIYTIIAIMMLSKIRGENMAKRISPLKSAAVFGMIFQVLYHLHAGMIATNVGFTETLLAIVFYYLPIVYAVYRIIDDPDEIPQFIRMIALFGASFLVINEFYNFMVDSAILIGGEQLAYELWPLRFLPIILWIGFTYLIDTVKVDFGKVRILFTTLLYGQLAMLIYIVVHHIYNAYTMTDGVYFFVRTEPHLFTLLNIALPFSYLIMYNFNPKYFERPYKRAVALSMGLMLLLIFLAKGTPVDNTFNFENTYYLDSLYLNYPIFIAYLFGFFEAVVRLFLALFLYMAAVQKLGENEEVNTKRSISIIGAIVAILLYIFVFRRAVDMADLMHLQFSTGFVLQLIYVLIMVFYGFYVGLKKFERTAIKFGLYLFPSFIVLYYVYNMSKVWEPFSKAYVYFLNYIDNYLLIFSLIVIAYYTLETGLLWYAYSKNMAVTDLGQAPIEKDYHMYIMIPCMNEEIVIGNTLTSILSSTYENLHVVVIDDGSEDGTADVVRSFDDSRLRLVQRVKPNAQQGKGEALNYVYYMLRDEIEAKGTDFDDVLIAIIDADTILPLQYFEKVNYVFNYRREVTGLQSKVRVISTNNDKAQDLEFAEIINATQTWRSITNTVAFGGNGQFCKLSTLDGLGEEPWSKSLVEDFDLSTRLFLSENVEAKHAQYSDIYIVQSGIENDAAALVKQRVRWSQGNIQSSKYIWPIIKAHTLQKRQKTELLMTLLKPWMMGIEYVIVIYTMVTIVDILIVSGMNRMIFGIIVLFLLMLLYILAINTVWAYLYNRNKPGKTTIRGVIIDCYYLTKFLLVLSQIYPQSAIRYFKSENGWDKTKRQQGGM